jgi:hypothetical protein
VRLQDVPPQVEIHDVSMQERANGLVHHDVAVAHARLGREQHPQRVRLLRVPVLVARRRLETNREDAVPVDGRRRAAVDDLGHRRLRDLQVAAGHLENGLLAPRVVVKPYDQRASSIADPADPEGIGVQEDLHRGVHGPGESLGSTEAP